jgi:hypothetical protein
MPDRDELMKQAGWGESERPTLSERDGVRWRDRRERPRREREPSPPRERGSSGLFSAVLVVLVVVGAAIAGVEVNADVNLKGTGPRAALVAAVAIGLWLALGSGRRLALTRLVGLLLVGGGIFVLFAEDG